MLFYKFINNNVIVDARNASTITYIKKSKKSNRVFICYNKDEADGVLIKDKQYFFNIDNPELSIKMEVISPLEYEEIKNFLIEDNENLNTEDQLLDTTNDYLNTVKLFKFDQLSKSCKKNITAGIDIHYSENITKHFDLTVEDQLNLNSLRYQLLTSDQDTFAYHSKNDDFEYYNRKEVEYIIASADKHILYHTVYFNSLKKYVNSLASIDEINAVEYGQDFPDMYKSQVLLEISDK